MNDKQETDEELGKRIPEIITTGKITIDSKEIRIEGCTIDCKGYPKTIALAITIALAMNALEQFGTQLIKMSPEDFENSTSNKNLNTFINVGNKDSDGEM